MPRVFSSYFKPCYRLPSKISARRDDYITTHFDLILEAHFRPTNGKTRQAKVQVVQET